MDRNDAFAIWQRKRTEQQRLACNEVSARFGLALTQTEMQMLEERHMETLQKNGRVEFGEGILPKLAQAFCDSPYLTQACYAETLAELQELFYAFKGEALELVSDDELLSFLRSHFDGDCQGSLTYLQDLTAEELCRRIRYGDAFEETAKEERTWAE